MVVVLYRLIWQTSPKTKTNILTRIPPFPSYQSVLVESPVSLAVSPGVISLDPSLSECPPSASASSATPAVGRKGGAGGGKRGKKKDHAKKDPNEPQKPVSAYALFFRDTQAAIKGQNPNATFGEVSKIVASMWDSLGEEQKQVRRKWRRIARISRVVSHGAHGFPSLRFTRGRMKQQRKIT